MKNNPFLLLAASLSLAMIFTFSCSGDGSVIDSINNSGGSDIWDGRINTTWYDNSKKEFTITTAQQLAGLAKLVNDYVDDFLGKTIKLGKDINLSGINWAPIGMEQTFAGTFDGNGYEIKGVKIKFSDNDSAFKGLFGALDLNGEIKNLGVIDSDIKGINAIGGLVGINNGKINKSYFIGIVEGNESVGGLVGRNILGTISDSYSAGYVYGSEMHVGGLVGQNAGTISSCYSTSIIFGKEGDVGGRYGVKLGGLVGYNYPGFGIIMNSYSTGTVMGKIGVGGFVGLNESEISNSYSIGTVSADTLAGGFVGWNKGEISNSYSIGAVLGDSLIGGFVGFSQTGSTINNSFYNTETSKQSESDGGTGKTTAEMNEQATYTGWDFSTIWGLSSTVNSGYPYLRSVQ